MCDVNVVNLSCEYIVLFESVRSSSFSDQHDRLVSLAITVSNSNACLIPLHRLNIHTTLGECWSLTRLLLEVTAGLHFTQRGHSWSTSVCLIACVWETQQVWTHSCRNDFRSCDILLATEPSGLCSMQSFFHCMICMICPCVWAQEPHLLTLLRALRPSFCYYSKFRPPE